MPDEYRYLAQEIGTDVIRAKDPDHWVKLFGRNLLLSDATVVVVDDIRFPNERRCCDFVVFIEPHGFTPKGLGSRATHESEQWNLAGPGDDPVVINKHGALKETAEKIIHLASEHFSYDASP